MKRFILKLVVVLGFALFVTGCALIQKHSDTKADEIVEEQQQEQIVEDDGYSIDDFKNDLTSKLSQYMDESIVYNIIKWLTDIGVLGALFGVYLKYRKYKHTTLEDVAKSSEELINKKIEEIKTNQSEEDKKNAEKFEQILKILILSQDNSTKGKIALLECLGVKTDSEALKENVEEVKNNLEEQQAQKDEINKEVQSEYKDLF